MKKIMIILAAICSIITGCMNNEKTISLAQIKESFEEHGIPLLEPAELNTESVFLMTLNDAAPETYIINDDHQLISIYMYSSNNGVKKAIKDFENKTAAADVVAHGRYQVANVLIIYDYESSFKDDRVEKVIKDIKFLAQ